MTCPYKGKQESIDTVAKPEKPKRSQIETNREQPIANKDEEKENGLLLSKLIPRTCGINHPHALDNFLLLFMILQKTIFVE